MPRRKKHKPIILNLRKETMMSIAAVVMILIGILVVISFSGKGVVLNSINHYLSLNFGLASLFLPFIFIASGLVLFHADYFWAKPHVLLGTCLMAIGTLGLFRSGEIGKSTFANLSQMISPVGAGIFFFAILITGLIIMMQLSLAEVLEWFSGLMPKQMGIVDKDVELEQMITRINENRIEHEIENQIAKAQHGIIDEIRKVVTPQQTPAKSSAHDE